MNIMVKIEFDVTTGLYRKGAGTPKMNIKYLNSESKNSK